MLSVAGKSIVTKEEREGDRRGERVRGKEAEVQCINIKLFWAGLGQFWCVWCGKGRRHTHTSLIHTHPGRTAAIPPAVRHTQGLTINISAVHFRLSDMGQAATTTTTTAQQQHYCRRKKGVCMFWVCALLACLPGRLPAECPCPCPTHLLSSSS